MRTAPRWFAIASLMLACATPTAAQVPTQLPARVAASGGLQRLLDAELVRFPGKAGVWVKHLTTGEEAGVHAHDTFNTASVIKIPVLVLAMQLADQGSLSLSERIPIGASEMRGGSGIFRYQDPGLQPTFRDVLTQMIITSDNTATDIAIGKTGGVDAVNRWLVASGYGGTVKLSMTTADLFAKYAALPQGADRNDKTSTDRSYWLGEMTPHATGRMLEAIQRCHDGTAPTPAVASKAACADMMRMMRGQQSGARRLPHFLNVPVAHKTGDFPPALANDVGVIFTRSGPVVVAFFANAIEGPYADAEDRIGRIAQRIVDYFDGAR